MQQEHKEILSETQRYVTCQILSCFFGLHLLPQILVGLHSQTKTKIVTSALNKPVEVPDIHFRLVHAHDPIHGNNVLQLGILLFFIFSMFSMYLVTKPIAEHSTIVVFVFRGSMGIVLGVPMFYVGAVLFGAPMTELVTQTMTWSVIQSMFVVLPLAAARKFEIHLWKRVYALNDARSVFELCSSWAGIGSIIGAWFGACLIPLDWDEPWQKWPITLIYGGSLGFVVGHVVGYYQIKKRLKKKGGMTFLVPKTMREKL